MSAIPLLNFDSDLESDCDSNFDYADSECQQAEQQDTLLALYQSVAEQIITRRKFEYYVKKNGIPSGSLN